MSQDQAETGRPVIYLDTETGGLLDHHPTIQVAAYVPRTGERFERKLAFDESACDPEALALNGYDRDVWAREAVSPASAWCDLYAFMSAHAGARIGGHNVVAFDLPRVRREFERLGLGISVLDSRSALDTRQLALWARELNLVGAVSLQPLADSLGVTAPGRAHDALHDAMLSAGVASVLMRVLWPPWDPDRLRCLVGKLALVPGGSVSAYLEQNREVAGLADDSTRTELAEEATPAEEASAAGLRP